MIISLMKCTLTGTAYKVYGYKGKQVRDNIHSSDLVNAFYHFYQSPRVAEVGIHLSRDILWSQSLTARACWRCRGQGNSSICANTFSKRSGNSRLKNREAGVVPSEARQSKLCSTVHTG
jgi:hypothetical protein